MSPITNRLGNLTILLALLILGAFTVVPANAAIDPYKLEPIATVDGIKITRLSLDNAVATLLPYVSLHKSVSERRYEQTRKKALYQLIDVELIYKRAKKNNEAKAKESEIDEKLNIISKSIPKGQTIEQILKNSDMSMADLREELNKTIVIVAQKAAKKKELLEKAAKKVDTAYMKKYYKDNINKFKEPKKIKLSNLLLKVDPSGGPQAWEKTRKEILGILKEARDGADFNMLAKKYSQGPNAAKGGDMGWVHQGSILEELDHAASSLKKGELSEPVMTLYGYHLLKLTDSKPASQKKFSELNLKNLKKQLEKKEFRLSNQAWIEDLRKNAKIEILVKDLY